MPHSPATSLFASDYSLSAAGSPVSLQGPPSPRPSPSPRISRASPARNLTPATPASPSPLRPRPLDTTLKTHDVPLTDFPTPPVSPFDAPLNSPYTDDKLTSRPAPVSGRKKTSAAVHEDVGEEKRSSFSDPPRRKSLGYSDFEGCMEGKSPMREKVVLTFAGGLGHETKVGTYKVGTEKAYHHLRSPRSRVFRRSALLQAKQPSRPARESQNAHPDRDELPTSPLRHRLAQGGHLASPRDCQGDPAICVSKRDAGSGLRVAVEHAARDE